ncbi:MAG TPA: hypothetical protein VMK42_11715, partial [Anaeromyxobacteraceae bacterium]|nr:hypothetical protein [Anaeromyxobacteraceae bacterium]
MNPLGSTLEFQVGIGPTLLSSQAFPGALDVHLNPKIGRDWMLPGHRRYVLTPGQNKKRFVAGALNAKTRKLTWV